MSDITQAPRYLVKVTSRRPSDGTPMQGTGVFIAPTLLLTCRHVVRYQFDPRTPEDTHWADDIRIGWGPDGAIDPIPARVYRPEQQEDSRGQDIVLLEVGRTLNTAEIPPWGDPGDSLRPGDRVTQLAYPDGIFLRCHRDLDTCEPDGVLIKGAFQPGASGGVLAFAQHGNLRFPFFALIRDSAYTGCKATPYASIARHLKTLGLRLPSQPLENPLSVTGDPAGYQSLLCRELGKIKLQGFLIDGRLQSVDIEQLWVPAKTYSTAPENRVEGSREMPLAEAVNQHRCLAVVGEAGSGKSTFLKRIGYALARPNRERETIRLVCQGVPLWVPLRELENFIEANIKKGEPYPSEPKDLRWLAFYLASRDEAVQTSLAFDYFDRQLRRDPETLLLMDGFDEVSSHCRYALKTLIETAGAELRCRVVVSTRPEAGDQLPSEGRPRATPSGIFERFTQVAILPLDNPAVERFIELWTSAFGQTSAEVEEHSERLRRAVRGRHISRLARNSLMLTAMAVLTSNGQHLPEQRAALFEKIVDWLVNSRCKDQPEEANTLRLHLANLALGMIEQTKGNQYQIPMRRAAELIEGSFSPKPPRLPADEAEEYLERAERNTGLLTRRGAYFTFWHRYLQEFLAAWRLSNVRKKREATVPRLLKSKQSPEVVRLVGGCMVSRAREDLSEMLVDLIERAHAWSLEERAYAVGLIGSLLEDLRPTDYYPGGAEFREVRPKWEALSRSVLAIFEKNEAAKIPLKTRVAAAEALGQAGDPRLRLPKAGLGDTRWREYWVEVPGGEFWMGAQKHTPGAKGYDPEAEDDEDRGKRNPVQVETFLMGKHPVTVYEYDVYLQAAGLEAPVEMKFEEQMEHPSRPLVNVTWQEACDYCQWAGGRLPSEEEWEYAARGPESWKYPWGNEPEPQDDNLANFFDLNVGAPTPVGLFPAGAQQETGVLDLSGNVWEWTSSLYKTSGKNRVLRGGSFNDNAWGLRAAYRYLHEPVVRSDDFGFRCVREVFA